MPNWRTDKRKKRVTEGKCAIEGCPRPSVLSYYNYGLCDKHEAYYFDEDMPSFRLKDVLKIPMTPEDREREEALWKVYKKDQRAKRKLEDWEKEMFT
jgi:hypothetical protein